MLKIKDLYKSFGEDAHPLQGANLNVANGEVILLMGRSGSGKSTFINCVCGIEVPDKGEIYINNKLIDMSDKKEADRLRREDIGIVFQQYYLLSNTTVYNQIALICDAKQEDIYDILKALEIFNLKDKNIEDCSGGQQQRVCIARALAKKPKLILADEPTANLDYSLALASIELMAKAVKKLGSALVVITHDDRILSLSDKVYHLENGKIRLSEKETV